MTLTATAQVKHGGWAPRSLTRRLAGRVATEERVDAETADRYVDAMLQFLDVCTRAERPLRPSPAIDAAWHAFILHTRAYADYCEERFGRFIHHQPTAAGDGDPLAYARARSLAAERFGALDQLAWPELAAGADCRCEEGKCEGDPSG